MVSCLIDRAFRAFGLRVEAAGRTAPFRGPLAALLHVRAGCAGSGGLSYIVIQNNDENATLLRSIEAGGGNYEPEVTDRSRLRKLQQHI